LAWTHPSPSWCRTGSQDTAAALEALATGKRQQEAARGLLESGQDLFLPKTVALELEWVLRGNYGFGVEQVLEDRPALEQAVSGVRSGLAFADALHHASCRDCDTIASFDDRGFARRIRQLNLPARVAVP